MPDASDVTQWPEKIRQRYESYLRTSFFFRDADLRASFQAALQQEGSLLKGPFPEPPRDFTTGVSAGVLAQECFSNCDSLVPALLERPLYTHQERAVRGVHIDGCNIVVATGTASGKTESFLYPILFELYRQHLVEELGQPGVLQGERQPLRQGGGLCWRLASSRCGGRAEEVLQREPRTHRVAAGDGTGRHACPRGHCGRLLDR